MLDFNWTTPALAWLYIFLAYLAWRLGCLLWPAGTHSVLKAGLPATYFVGNKEKSREQTEGKNWGQIKAEVFKRDRGRCQHCGCECFVGKPTQDDIARSRRAASFGHWVPNTIGGPEVPGNLHISCPTCNKLMGSKVILQPAIDFAASRGETICTKGLEIHLGIDRITELYGAKRKLQEIQF